MGQEDEPQLAASRSAVNERRETSERRSLIGRSFPCGVNDRGKDQTRGGRSMPKDEPSLAEAREESVEGPARMATTSGAIAVTISGESGVFGGSSEQRSRLDAARFGDILQTPFAQQGCGPQPRALDTKRSLQQSAANANVIRNATMRRPVITDNRTVCGRVRQSGCCASPRSLRYRSNLRSTTTIRPPTLPRKPSCSRHRERARIRSRNMNI